MAGRTPAEALHNFIQPLREALRGVTPAPLSVPSNLRAGLPRLDAEYTASLGGGSLVRLRGPNAVALRVSHAFRIVEWPDGDERGPYKASTVRYWYYVATHSDQELLAYHWTPHAALPEKPFPHLHVGSLVSSQSAFMERRFNKLHIPTGRVSLESVLRFLIEDLDVTPNGNRDVVLARLRQSEEAFLRYRTI